LKVLNISSRHFTLAVLIGEQFTVGVVRRGLLGRWSFPTL